MEPWSGSNPCLKPVGTPAFRGATRSEQSGPVPNPDRCWVTRNGCKHYSFHSQVLHFNKSNCVENQRRPGYHGTKVN